MTMRPIELDEVPRLTALINRFESHWEVPIVSTPEQVEDDLTEPFVDLEADSRGVWDGGELIGYGLVYHRPSGERLERSHMVGMVDPDRLGEGYGRQIFEWQLERSIESLRQCDPGLPWYARTAEFDWIEPAHRLYRRFGLEPVRYIKEMLMPLDRRIAAGEPTGVTIVPWDRRRDEEAREVLNEAFADHWGSTPTDVETFRHRVESHGIRVDLSFLAVAGDEVVGVCLNASYPEDEAISGRREGWVEILGVSRPWRGRGVATALISASLDAFAQEGMTHGAIGVDADNPTGAFQLYRRIGFEIAQGMIISQIEVSA
ncbi:MAG: GNAT family N-acetyltransferase [Acidimicrobiia bacterium]